MTRTPKITAVLKLPQHVPDILKAAQAIVTSMTGKAVFPSPVPPLPAVSAAIDALSVAETNAASRAKGAAQVRDEKLAVLVTALAQLKAYVQLVADGDPTQAASIIMEAGMLVRQPPARSKPTFQARRGAVSGEAKLMARAASNRASYEWQWSLDQKTWTNAPVTLQAKTVIPGLTPGQLYSFRFRPVTKAGEGDWSGVATLLVS